MADVGKKTGKQTQAGRDVYETPEGEMVSEKSTTFEYEGKWINIPTIHGGKQYSEDQLIKLLDEGLIEPTSTHDELEEAIEAAQSRSDSLEFNKGGTPMEEQMELFEDGGLKDEGGMVDEESGNDVPSGSTKKEVRDDIPAMLSEGEFVLPADVVRYHGLEKIMQLRDEAKFGLKKMEAMGQMGNSDEATLDDDIPFGPADLIIVGAEPMEGEEEPREMAQGGMVYAQSGTFVPPSTGIAGYQPSIYQGQQTTGAYTPPPSSVAPPIPAPSPAGGYMPKFMGQPNVGVAASPVSVATAPSSTDTSAVSTASTDDKFVKTVTDAYKSIEYIDPQTLQRKMFNFYNGAVINGPIPDGMIPVTEWEASQQTDTGTTTTTGTGVDSTSVTTTQVTDNDDGKQTIRALQEAKEKRDRESPEAKAQSDLTTLKMPQLIDRYLANERVSGAGNVLSFFSPLVGVAAKAAAMKEKKQLEEILNGKFPDWKKDAKIKEYMEGGKLKSTKLFGSKFLEDAKAAVSGFGANFTAEGQKDFYNNYTTQYNIEDNTLSGGATGFVDSGKKLDNGLPASSGNLSVKEQQAYDNAVKSGDDSVANHYAIIAKHREGQDNYANAVAQFGADSVQAQNAGKNMSSYSKQQAIKYGGSVHSAVQSGDAKKTTTGFSFFSKYKTPAEQAAEEKAAKSDDDSSNDSANSSGGFGGYSCYVATALNDKGYWPTIKKMKLIKWCMDTKPEHKFETKLWRNGYTVFGKTIIAPHVDNKIIRWLSDGFYEATVKNKKSLKALIGLLFFYVPSYTIALYKMLRNDLVEIERT